MNPDLRQLLLELARRRPVVADIQRNEAAEMAATLRSFYYDKQRAFFTSKAKLRATSKTRRAGATTGGCREFVARAIEYPGWRGTYVTTTRKEARERAWLSDTQSGLLDVLRKHGTNIDHPSCEAIMIGGVVAFVRDQAMTIDFSNGSKIDLFGADDERAMRKQRGLSKHVYWIDEAQDFRFLETFYDAVIIGSLTDYKGECWLSGTPGRDCAGMFYEATKEPEDGPRLEGWETHTIACIDNPYFGAIGGSPGAYAVIDNDNQEFGPYKTLAECEKAARTIRWDNTAGAAKIAKNWKGDEPDFVREWLGKWSKVDARYVYPVHTCNPYDLLYASQRLMDNPFKGTHPRYNDHPPWINVQRSLLDMPKMPKFNKKRQWMFSIGADFGYHPDPFAIVVWAFAHDTQDVYEFFSWKATKVHTDDQGLYLQKIWQDLDNVVCFVGDPAGKQDDFEVWRTRMGLPIDDANKRGKNTLEEFLADDIRRGRVHLRHDSPLHDEMKHLIYLPTKPGKPREAAKHRRSGDNIVHGDHCCLVAGTSVRTASGEQPIESIAVGTLVPTRGGLRPVTHAFPAGAKPTYRMIASDGSELVGTHDHPVWTENGWKDLASLIPGDTLTTCTSDHLKLSPGWENGIAGILKAQNDLCATISAEREKSEASLSSSTYIAPFGNRFTARFQKTTTFTTLMKTRSTTTLPISAACSEKTTSDITGSNQSVLRSLAATLTSRASKQKSGTGQKPVLRGTENTGEKRCSNASPSHSPASSALPATNPRMPTASFAATSVNPQHVEHPASMMSTVSAASAEPATASASSKKGIAAPVRVLSVEPTGRVETVYNLTVADRHEYFANGLLVSNCDAARYSYEALTHYLSKTPATVPKPGTLEAMKNEAITFEKQIEKAEMRRAEELAAGDEDMGYGESLYEWNS